MKNQNVMVAILAAVVIGGAAFFGGVKYQQGKQAKSLAQMRGQFGRNGQGAFRGGRAVTGEIMASDEKTLTLKLTDNSSKIVILSSNTNINKATQGSKDDLKVGIKVSVFGADNSDGSVTAQNIQLNPEARLGAQTDANVKTFNVEGGSYYFKPNEIRVKKGDKVRIVFTNKDGMHDLVLDEFNFKIGLTAAGQTTEDTFTADKTGTFEFYCSVSEHRARGQVGTLIVE